MIFAAELLVDKAMELKYIGGVYSGNVKPTPFLCLVLKMLQIQPDKDIIVEFISNEDYKFVCFICVLICFQVLTNLYIWFQITVVIVPVSFLLVVL